MRRAARAETQMRQKKSVYFVNWIVSRSPGRRRDYGIEVRFRERIESTRVLEADSEIDSDRFRDRFRSIPRSILDLENDTCIGNAARIVLPNDLENASMRSRDPTSIHKSRRDPGDRETIQLTK